MVRSNRLAKLNHRNLFLTKERKDHVTLLAIRNGLRKVRPRDVTLPKRSCQTWSVSLWEAPYCSSVTMSFCKAKSGQRCYAKMRKISG